MTTYVALLRGINVGGHTRVAMADLREILESLRHEHVRTLLQSGNAVFSSSRRDRSAIVDEIEAALKKRTGHAIRVILRTRADLEKTVAANPLPAAAANPTFLHVAFLSADPDKAKAAAIDPAAVAPDEFRFGDRAMYIWYKNGSGRSKLTNALTERRLGVVATARNWNTVLKLLEMVKDQPD